MNRTVEWYFQYIFSFHCAYVYHYDLTKKPSLEGNKDIEIRILDENSIDDLVAFHDKYCETEWERLFNRKDVETRLRAGHTCYICSLGSRIVAFAWFSPKSLNSPDLKCLFGTRSSCLINYNDYTDKTQRGRNVIFTLKKHAFHRFCQEEYFHCYAFIRSDNISALRSAAKVGGNSCGKIFYGYLIGLHFIFMKNKSTEFFILKRESVFSLYRHIFRKLFSPVK